MVSACIITYNHDNYILESIEGAFEQVLDYPYEIVIVDDFSTDKTRQICREFALKNPSKIKYFENAKNIGMHKNWTKGLNSCSGKYIAICEGDDNWADPHKLKRQIEFLERNPEYTASFTNANQIGSDDKFEKLFVTKLNEGCVHEETIILKGGGLYPTASLVFRNDPVHWRPFLEISEIACDESLIMALALKGKIHFENRITCIYRNWKGGAFSSIKDNVDKILELKERSIKGYRKFDKLSNGRFRKYLNRKISIVSLYIILNSKRLWKYKYLFNLKHKEIIRLIVSKLGLK